MEVRIASLRERAMLATVSVSCWRGQKHDRAVTAEVHASHGASANAGRYNKHCLDKADLAAVVSAQTKARAAFYELTLPWGDAGLRLLPTANFEKLAAAVEESAAETREAAAELAAKWPEIVARREREMNGLFNRSDYPAQGEIASRYSVRLAVYEIPDSSDFRVALDAEQLATARAAIEDDATRALASATRDVLGRMLKPVQAMVERLPKYKVRLHNDGRAEIVNPFRDSLVENVREVVRALPALNVAGDGEIAALIERIEAQLCARDPEELRSSARVRREVAAQATSIASDVQSILDAMGGAGGGDDAMAFMAAA